MGLLLMVLVGHAEAQLATTQVQDVVYQANGSPNQGTVIVSWPAFSTSGGQAVPAGSTTVAVGANGVVSVALVPNAGSTPMGSYYTVAYHMADGTVSREYWVVPVSTSAVTISSIRSTVLPTSMAIQTVSKAYVDNAISSLSSSSSGTYVLKAGDTMSGQLVLPSDPVTANQAADKHYVDAGTAALTAGLGQKVSLMPAGTQTVSQPTGTGLGVNDLNGAMYVSQYQTGTNNNGIANITTGPNCTTGCTLFAEPNYGGTEHPYAYNEIGTVNLGWNARTHLKDLRGGGEIDSYQDPQNANSGGYLTGHTTLYASTLDVAGLKAKYGDPNPSFYAERIVQSALTGGNSLETQNGQVAPYGKTTYTALKMDGTYTAQGQHVMNSDTMNCYGVGDCMIAGYRIRTSGGWRDGSDEGAHPGGMKVEEDSNVPTGICAGGCTAGSTQVSIGSLSYPLGEGRYLIDKAAANIVSSSTTGCGLSGGVQQSYPFSQVTFNGSNCFPVSTFLLAAAPVAPQTNQMSPGTVTVAIATSGLPTGYAASTAGLPNPSGLACVADTIPSGRAESSFETVNYTTVDATHLSITFNKPHGFAPTIAVGGMCGYGLEATVDTRSGIRQAVPVVGSFSATGLYYAANNVVGMAITGGTSSFSNVSANISSISRTSNVTTVVLSSSIPDLNGLTVTVAGVADSSYNGSFTITSVSGNSFTYPNTGTNGTSTGGAMSYVTGGFNLYPMAEVLEVLNPATNVVDGGNLKLAPNNVNWAANDPLEEPHFHISLTQGDGQYNYLAQTMPRPNYGEAMGDGTVFGGYNGSSMVGYFMYNTTPAASYYGNGGTLGAPKASVQVQGPWANIFDVSAGESTVLNVHCNSHGCNRWDSAYNLFALQTNSQGTATVSFNPTTDTISSNIPAWSFGGGNMSNINALSSSSLAIGGGAAITNSNNLCQASGTNCPSGLSKPLAGSGVAVPTGPSASTNSDLVSYTGTAGQEQDSGVAASGLSNDGTTLGYTGGGGLNVNTGSAGVGVAGVFTSSNTSATNIEVINTSTGGHKFNFFSTGSGNSSGAGNFGVYDATAGAFRMSIGPTGVVGFGTANQFQVDASGNSTAITAKANSFAGGGSAATVAIGSAAGGGATAVCASGYTCLNARGKLTIVAGSSPAAGTIATVTFAAAYGTAPICTVTQNGGASFLGIGSNGETATTFNVTSGVPIAGTVTVNYQCMQ